MATATQRSGLRELWLFDINPVPWTSPTVSVGRRNGKPFPMVYASAELKAYQEAVREAVAPMWVEPPLEGDLWLSFKFWRDLPLGVMDDEKARNRRAHIADATNMQKALEDALQGILYKNDNRNQKVESEIVVQAAGTRPAILVQIGTISRKTDISPPYPSAVEATTNEREGFEVEDVF